MALLTEKTRDWEFLISENNGDFARDQFTLILGQNLEAGTVLGRITVSGKFTILAPAAADGSQTVAGILGPRTDATAADKRTAGMLGGTGVSAEVNGALLKYPVGITAPQRATAITQLNALGFKLR